MLKPSSVFYVSLTPPSPLADMPGPQGVFNGRKVSQVPTDPLCASLGKRRESSRVGKALKDFGCKLAQPFTALARGLCSAFAKSSPPAYAYPPAPSGNAALPVALSLEQLLQGSKDLVIDSGLRGTRMAAALLTITGDELQRTHSDLARNNGALRRISTGLTAFAGSCPPALAARANALLTYSVGELPFKLWATTGQTASQWVELARKPLGTSDPSEAVDAARAQIEDAARDMQQLAAQVLTLVSDVEAYVAEPSPRAAETQGAPSTDSPANALAFKRLFEQLGQSSRIAHDSSEITLEHSRIALVLKAMREGSINPDALRQQIQTGAELKLMQSLYSARDLQAPSLEAILLDVASGEATHETTLGNISVALMRFVRAAETRWNAANSAAATPATTAGQRFNAVALELRGPLQGLDSTAAHRVLNQLQGPLGTGLRAILGAVDEGRQVLAQRESAALSADYLRVNGLVSVMIAMLREQLMLPVLSSRGSLGSRQLSLLVPQELVALARVMQDDGR